MLETVDKLKSWVQIRKNDWKFETEALIFAVEEQTLRTIYIKFNIDR